MQIYETIEDLKPLVGKPIGTSEWMTVSQPQVNQFADATGDHQWIHVEPERARQGPFGGPIAHGFLTLSLLPAFGATAYRITNSRMGVNYGLDKVRFPAPVPVGSRLRGHFRLLSWEGIDHGGAQMKIELKVECDGMEKPVCIAELIVRRFP